MYLQNGLYVIFIQGYLTQVAIIGNQKRAAAAAASVHPQPQSLYQPMPMPEQTAAP